MVVNLPIVHEIEMWERVQPQRLLTVQVIDDGQSVEGQETVLKMRNRLDSHELRSAVRDLNGLVEFG